MSIRYNPVFQTEEVFEAMLSSMFSSYTPLSLTFSALKDHMGESARRPVQGSDGPVKVMTLAKDTWTPKACHKTAIEIAFDTDERAYMKPNFSGGDALKERGAYVLSRLFGLNVVPDTRILELGQTSVKKKPGARGLFTSLSGLYSIQQGVLGHSLDTKAGIESLNRVIQSGLLDKRSLHALYAYIFIASDPDHEEQNVMLETDTGRLWSIDNAYSGSDFEGYACFPEALDETLFEEAELSPAVLSPIKRALSNPARRDQLYRCLKPYYGKEKVIQMIQRAEFLLAHPQLGSLVGKFRAFKKSQDFKRMPNFR